VCIEEEKIGLLSIGGEEGGAAHQDEVLIYGRV